jgi:hypothetical protein
VCGGVVTCSSLTVLHITPVVFFGCDIISVVLLLLVVVLMFLHCC